MITYRKAEQKDKKGFSELEREFYKAYEEMGIEAYLQPTHYADIKEEDLVRLFEESLNDKYFFYVAEEDERIVGYIFAEVQPVESKELYKVQEVGFIDSLVVLEAYRNKGIGTELLNRAIDWFKSNGITICKIGVMKENSKVLQMYEKIGFQAENIKMWKQI